MKIDRTHDRKEEADLWRDGLFGRRVVRYLCLEKTAPSSVRQNEINQCFFQLVFLIYFENNVMRRKMQCPDLPNYRLALYKLSYPYHCFPPSLDFPTVLHINSKR